MEFFVCNADETADPDGIPTQECFNKYPLNRAVDDGDASPIDTNYPGRYYVDPECRASETDQSKPEGAMEEAYVITARYQLPLDLSCDRCILQLVYCESRVLFFNSLISILGRPLRKTPQPSSSCGFHTIKHVCMEDFRHQKAEQVGSRGL